MKFEAGGYYGFKGKQQMVMFILHSEHSGILDTHTWGPTLIGEVNIRGSLPALRAVGCEEEHAEGWAEITKEEFIDVSCHWMDEFAEAHCKQAERQKEAEAKGIQTAFRKLVTIITHPQRKSVTMQLMCGHTIKLTAEEWAKLQEANKDPKKGSMQFCGMCDIQNRALAGGMVDETGKEVKPGVAAGEEGKVLEFSKG